jgi:2-oxoisovalerate dehydrogenase E1 component alpha subunit
MAARDAITLFGKRLADEGILDGNAQAEITKSMHNEVDAAIDFARNSPEPAPEDALLHVFAEGGAR